MGFPRIAASSDVSFDTICRLDEAIAPVVYDFEAVIVSAGLTDEPGFKKEDEAGDEAGATERTSREIAETWLERIQKWQKAKAQALIADYLKGPAAAYLGSTAADLKDLITEQTARTVLQSLLDSARWGKYCETGDEGELEPFADGETPIRFVVTPLAERDKVHVLGKQDAGTPKDSTDFAEMYDLNLWVLRRTLKDVKGWPSDYPDIVLKDGCLDAASLALLPYPFVNALGAFIMNQAELREAEKKA